MKRYLSLILCLCLMITTLTGCVNQNGSVHSYDGQTETSKAPETAESASAAQETAEAVEATEGPPDEEPGEPESVQAQQHDFKANLPLSEQPATVSALSKYPNLMGPLSALNISEYTQFDYWSYLTEITNVDVEFTYISFMAWTEQYNLFIVAGEYTDMVFEGSYTSGLLAGVEDDFILDMTSYIEEYAPNYYSRVLDYDYEDKVTTEGYWLSFSSFYDEFRENQGLLIRKDWLDALGLDIPETWDEYYNVLTAFKTEYDPFITININSECAMTNFGGYDFPLYSVGNSNLPYYQIDGTIYCSINEDGYKEYLQTLNQYYKDGIIEKDFMTRSYDPMSSEFNGWISTNNLGLWNASIEGISTVNNLEKDEGFEITAAIGPVENEGAVKRCSTISITDMPSVILTTGCKDIELVMRWMDFWYTDEGVLLYNYGIEGVDYTEDGSGVVFDNSVVNNEYVLSLDQYLRARTPFAMLTGVAIRTRTATQYDDLQIYAWDLWTSVTVDGDRAIPAGAELSAEASSERSAVAADIATYADERIPRFIMGELSFESDWDEYVRVIDSMNLARCIELTQDACNEYYRN